MADESVVEESPQTGGLDICFAVSEWFDSRYSWVRWREPYMTCESGQIAESPLKAICGSQTESVLWTSLLKSWWKSGIDFLGRRKTKTQAKEATVLSEIPEGDNEVSTYRPIDADVLMGMYVLAVLLVQSSLAVLHCLGNVACRSMGWGLCLLIFVSQWTLVISEGPARRDYDGIGGRQSCGLSLQDAFSRTFVVWSLICVIALVVGRSLHVWLSGQPEKTCPDAAVNISIGERIHFETNHDAKGYNSSQGADKVMILDSPIVQPSLCRHVERAQCVCHCLRLFTETPIVSPHFVLQFCKTMCLPREVLCQMGWNIPSLCAQCLMSGHRYEDRVGCPVNDRKGRNKKDHSRCRKRNQKKGD